MTLENSGGSGKRFNKFHSCLRGTNSPDDDEDDDDIEYEGT